MDKTNHSLMSAWIQRHVVLSAVLILACSASVRIGFAVRIDPGQAMFEYDYSDGPTYVVPAENLLEKREFLNSYNRPEVDRTPGYPAFLAVLLHFTNRDLHLALIAQAAILSLGVPILYLLAQKILPAREAFTGCLIAAFSPWGAVLAGIPMSDGLFVLLLTSIFLALKLIEESASNRGIFFGAALVGLLTAWAILVRPLSPFLLLVGGALLLIRGGWRKRIIALTVMLVFSLPPLFFWVHRNTREANFPSLSTVSGKTAWFYLAQRVKAQANGLDRYAVSREATKKRINFRLYPKEADALHWQQATAVFRAYPLLTVYCFLLSAAEHFLHPEARVLEVAGLGFPGDFWALATLWGLILTMAFVGWWFLRANDATDLRWINLLFTITALLTLASGLSFGAGSRLRAPMEIVIPLLAGVGVLKAEEFRRKFFAFRIAFLHSGKAASSDL
jgi:hypothetical protein